MYEDSLWLAIGAFGTTQCDGLDPAVNIHYALPLSYEESVWLPTGSMGTQNDGLDAEATSLRARACTAMLRIKSVDTQDLACDRNLASSVPVHWMTQLCLPFRRPRVCSLWLALSRHRMQLFRLCPSVPELPPSFGCSC